MLTALTTPSVPACEDVEYVWKAASSNGKNTLTP
jgi:hypothetical protein